MKIKAIPLLAGGDKAKSFFVEYPMAPRTFVDLLDRHKALLFQAPSTTHGSSRSSANGNSHTNGHANDSEQEFHMSVEEFGKFVSSLQLTYYPYIGGAAPRTIIPTQADTRPIIYTANESPPQEPIPFHHELAQCPNPPEYVFFYCDVPAKEGGQTPIIDSTAVYRYTAEHHADFLTKLKEHGVRYTRTLPAQDDPNSPIGRSYKNAWNVTSRAELDAKLSKINGCTWTWNDENDSVRITSEPVPAIRLVKSHCQNLVYQWTFANSIIAAFLGWQDSRNDRFQALQFGNHDPMPHTTLQSIADYMQHHRVMYSWKQGDVMALNNQLVMHSRHPFLKPRRVLASIWGGPTEVVRLAEPLHNGALGTRPPSYYTPVHPADPLVFGFWKVPRETCAEVTYQAIASGYRRLDCACDYGNEIQVGQGIARALSEQLVTREELHITSKLWNTYHHPAHVKLALQKTLEDLGVEYLDEYLIHFPISMEYVPIDKKYPPEWTNLEGKMVLVAQDLTQTWKAMETLVEEKLVKGIGLCNASSQLLRQIVSCCNIRPVTLQIELHPHNAQFKLIRLAEQLGMHVTAFSVLGASSYLELNMATEDQVLLHHPVIVKIAKTKHKSPAQVLIRWALQRNTRPLCKTLKKERMVENREVFDFYLTQEEMEEVDGLDVGRRYNDPGVFCEGGMGTFCPIYD